MVFAPASIPFPEAKIKTEHVLGTLKIIAGNCSGSYIHRGNVFANFIIGSCFPRSNLATIFRTLGSIFMLFAKLYFCKIFLVFFSSANACFSLLVPTEINFPEPNTVV